MVYPVAKVHAVVTMCQMATAVLFWKCVWCFACQRKANFWSNPAAANTILRHYTFDDDVLTLATQLRAIASDSGESTEYIIIKPVISLSAAVVKHLHLSWPRELQSLSFFTDLSFMMHCLMTDLITLTSVSKALWSKLHKCWKRKRDKLNTHAIENIEASFFSTKT